MSARGQAGLPAAVVLAAVRGRIPRAEARMLLCHALGIGHAHLAAHPETVTCAEALERFERWVARRERGEPIAYLLGWREFYGRRFRVGPQVLIPRPETELLVDRAIAALRAMTRVRGPARVADLGTGSGAIAISLALELPGAELFATDASEGALELARANAALHGARVRFSRGDWYGALDPGACFEVIACNPPYVAAGDPHLRLGDVRHEPRAALVAGADGLSEIRRIVAGAARFLAPEGWLLLEHGYDQAQAVRGLLAAAGFRAVGSWRDLAGIERVSGGVRAAH